ncbi:MAG: 50S ribosome-binding GTPase [Firmicutes bacterium]|nr:50S ribosome-binding GTPase [Bacillota bacterium]
MAQARAGQVPAWLKAAKATIIPWLARAEGAVDYGEDEGISLDLDALKRDFRPLLQQFHVEQTRSAAARWLRDGITLALVGRPNAGKSTLFNALAGEDRAIVTAHPGTTRDVLEVRCEWAGLPLVLFDTAGLRRANDPVERLGVERVAPVLERVDLVLHLEPASDPKPDEALLAHLEPFRAKVMDVYTFSDVASAEGIAISAATGDLTALEKALKARFLGDQAPEACLGALATQRQRELLDDMVAQVEMLLGLPSESPAEVVASLLQGLWELWARLTGEDRAESALDHLFTGFCLGK